MASLKASDLSLARMSSANGFQLIRIGYQYQAISRLFAQLNTVVEQ